MNVSQHNRPAAVPGSPSSADPAAVRRDGIAPNAIVLASQLPCGRNADRASKPATQPAHTAPARTQPQPQATPPETRPKVVSTRAIQLFAAAFAIPLLFDRLVLAGLTSVYGYPDRTSLLFAVFWLACAATVTALHWRAARTRPLAWFTVAAIAALAYWMVSRGGTDTGDPAFELITGLVAVPSLLMLHLQLVNGRYDVRRPLGIALRWFTGWIVQPFAGLGAFARAAADVAHALVRGRTRPVMRRIGVAALIAVPMLIAMTALLMNADMVFSYAVRRVIGDVDLASFLPHAAFVLVAFPFMFSLLDCQDRDRGELAALYGRSVTARPDALVASIVLGSLLAVYALFCAVQFTFLFAREGLPGGLTYAEYARSGFFQLLFVAAVNLALFGVVLTYVRRTRVIAVMLVGLVAATGVMLASAALRLALYVGAYGLTWLRFTSMTFIGLLASMLALCLVRMAADRLPLVAVCFVLFTLWFVALGYGDVASIVDGYNAAHGFDPAY
ncbi:hypothetical protein DSM100688_0280 [Bifidobacterium ramosum]|uniref:DUF4173 domain-containing protein n=1 Tax=Bifidobacterium ramosum TaxID=1798158 RepID=A0A6L4X2R5_9BIFI|nr:DUF4173 domain-containing protein [Bifidobacterium ramosum]KAB8289200.1 hypothetical protein DSM100688_0280 [Bifidobacterium ramosum]NEG70909.1 DUF4173 domain-containing protein [Bifidobacterium ramosum]